MDDDATARVEVCAAMNAVGVPLRQRSPRYERGYQHYGLPTVSRYHLRRSDDLLAAGLVTYRTREVSEEHLFLFRLFRENVRLPVNKCSYDIRVHGLEQHM